MNKILFAIGLFFFGYVTSQMISDNKNLAIKQAHAQISEIDRYRILGELVFEHAVIDIIMDKCMVDVKKVDDNISQGKVLCDKKKF